MTHNTSEDQRYYREIESHWSLRRENQIIVSPVEFECMEKWCADAIPLTVVCGAIDRFIARKKSRGGKRNFLLCHVDDTVRKLFAEYQSLHVGENTQGGGIDVTLRLQELSARVRRLFGNYPDRESIIGKTAEEIESIRSQDVVSLEELEDKLAQIDRKFLAEFKLGLSDDERRELEEDVAGFVDKSEDPELYQRLLDDVSRGHFQIPRLSVLG